MQTSLDEDDISLEVDHASLESGLNYVARAIVVVPTQEIEMIVENFDYRQN